MNIWDVKAEIINHKDSVRVDNTIVTVNGGGDAAGAGGGINTISLSASGTTRTMIDSTSTSGTPTFNEA